MHLQSKQYTVIKMYSLSSFPQTTKKSVEKRQRNGYSLFIPLRFMSFSTILYEIRSKYDRILLEGTLVGMKSFYRIALDMGSYFRPAKRIL